MKKIIALITLVSTSCVWGYVGFRSRIINGTEFPIVMAAELKACGDLPDSPVINPGEYYDFTTAGCAFKKLIIKDPTGEYPAEEYFAQSAGGNAGEAGIPTTGGQINWAGLYVKYMKSADGKYRLEEVEGAIPNFHDEQWGWSPEKNRTFKQ